MFNVDCQVSRNNEMEIMNKKRTKSTCVKNECAHHHILVNSRTTPILRVGHGVRCDDNPGRGSPKLIVQFGLRYFSGSHPLMLNLGLECPQKIIGQVEW